MRWGRFGWGGVGWGGVGCFKLEVERDVWDNWGLSGVFGRLCENAGCRHQDSNLG